MGNELSLFFYLISFSISAYLLSFGIRRRSKLFTAIALLIPILVGGFRFGVGTDYFNYVGMYNTDANLTLKEFMDKGGIAEVMFFAIEKLSYVLMNDPRFMFITSVTLTIVFFYIGLQRLKVNHPGLVYFLYLMILFPVTFNAVRQGIAISIVFLAFTYIIDKKPFRYLFWITVAGLFHISALFMLPVYLLGRYVDTERVKVVIKNHLPDMASYFVKVGVVALVVAIICSSVFSVVLSIPGFERYGSYLIYNEESNNYIFFVKLAVVITAIVLCRHILPKFNKRQNKLFLAFAIVEVVLLTLGFVSPFIKRTALYFSPFMLLLLPYLIDVFKRKSIKMTVYMLVVLYGITFFMVSYYLLGQAHVFPYEYSISGGVQ